ncbi:Dolichyl-phosphate-mannose-protein mannosyltransferase [Pseudobutyrivibrio sp. YE44]|uniref:glycosyltransferase family 39 protein n=1 Tax=Pseudobutyrivibrio sp. YE44 TaxID=1520802 RepID=UPI00088CD263|nr:glycosyltransferase family 39 protein [Pseudobutyrivibrio sp. YE44]SDB38902.1 Dolichyl-phosphate-mannose-protein mannosyltransferase [Pseudobutyrivibrio sp. YE44]
MTKLFNSTPFKIILAVVLGAAVFVNLVQGMYLDENGLLTLYRGIYQGERVFVDSWSEYNMAGVLMYPIFALYYQVLEPSLTSIGVGMVLYTRIVYMILRLLIAVYLYFTLKKTEFEEGAFYTALFYFLFIVGWRNFSYKSICDFGLILLICFIFRYCQHNHGFYFVLMGIASCICILAYPTMIILPFAFVIGGLILSYQGYEMIKNLTIYGITCLVCGALYLVYMQFTCGILQGINSFMLFLNSSNDYDDSFVVRLGMMVLSYVVTAAIAYFPVVCIELYKKFRAMSEVAAEVILGVYWIAFMVAVCVVKVDSISYSRYIYGILILFWWFPYFAREAKSSYTVVGSYKQADISATLVCWVVFAITCVSQGVWAISTNQDITVPGHMAYYIVLAMIAMLISNEQYHHLVTGLFLAEIFFTCIWMPDKNGGFHHVFEQRFYVTEGALQGVALSQEDYDKNQQVMELMNDYVTPEDKLLVTFAFNSTAYLNTDAIMATGSPYTRPQIDTQLLSFWESNPDYVANLVLIDKGIDKYQELLESECGQYLLSEYANEVATNGDFVLLSK